MKMRRIPITVLTVSAVVLFHSLAAAPADMSGLSATRYLDDVRYLASDELKGRGDGSPELDQAADYIAEQFRKAGLQPAGEGGSYFQNFEITTGATFGAKNELQVGDRPLAI